jgi:type VI protein secretion system component Hcp
LAAPAQAATGVGTLTIGDTSTSSSVYSVALNLTQPSCGHVATGSGTSQTTIGALEVTADIGDDYGRLMKLASTGQAVTSVVLTIPVSRDGSTFGITLRGALITALSAEGGSQAAAREKLILAVAQTISFAWSDTSGGTKFVEYDVARSLGSGSIPVSNYTVLLNGAMQETPGGSIAYGFSNGMTTSVGGASRLNDFVLTKQLDSNTLAEVSAVLGSPQQQFHVVLTKANDAGVAATWMDYTLTNTCADALSLESDISGHITETVSYLPATLQWDQAVPNGPALSAAFGAPITAH